jgi:formamidopyrimidine-DNA glycosylase
MPELPEVETIVRGLRGAILGRSIVGVRLGKTDFIDDPIALAEKLPGTRITAIERYGKFIALTLESVTNGDSAFQFFVHLGMTGQLIPRAAADAAAPHTHVFFELDDGRELRYTDVRRFGRMALHSVSAPSDLRRGLGADPLEISAADFVAAMRARRARVKALLLDQRVLRGIGNIYADESLWRARLHPARLGTSLTRGQLLALHKAMRSVLNDAIRLRGSSISDFLDSEGNPGEYQLRHRVYGRKGKPCPRCKTLIRRTVVAGRGSYFCPRCQAAPRARGKKRRAKK